MKFEKTSKNYRGLSLVVVSGPSIMDPAGEFRYTIHLLVYRCEWSFSIFRIGL